MHSTSSETPRCSHALHPRPLMAEKVSRPRLFPDSPQSIFRLCYATEMVSERHIDRMPAKSTVVTDLDALLSRRESLMPRESNGMSTRSTLASRELPCNIFICDNGQQCLNLETADCTGCVVGRCITSGFPHPGPIDK